MILRNYNRRSQAKRKKILSVTYIKYLKSEVLVTQLCPTLFDPMDYSPTGSSVPGIFEPRILE